jgi:hypothetical protein
MLILHFLQTLFACLLAAMRRTLSVAPRRRPERTQRHCIASRQRHKYFCGASNDRILHISQPPTAWQRQGLQPPKEWQSPKGLQRRGGLQPPRGLQPPKGLRPHKGLQPPRELQPHSGLQSPEGVARAAACVRWDPIVPQKFRKSH